MIEMLRNSWMGLIVVVVVLGSQPSRAPDRLVGRVTDSRGCPLPDAVVSATKNDGAPAQAVTDEHGEYTIVGVPRGLITVVAQESGFKTRSEVLATLTGENTWDTSLNLVRLSDSAHHIISGRLLDQASPVPDATVTIVEAMSAGRISQTRTDRDGRYQVEQYASGDFVVIVTSPLFKTLSQVVSLPYDDGAKATVDFNVAPRSNCRK